MPGWFVALFVLSLVGFACSWSGDLVLVTSIWTFGLMVPVWFLAANLWWVLLAIMPAMVLRERGKGAVGLAIGAGVLVALGVGSSAYLGQARTALTPSLPLPAPGLARAVGTPSSVEIVVLSEQPFVDSEGACGTLCQTLLTGPEIKWLRLQNAGQTGSEAVVYHRADPAACLALDPGSPTEAPCLLARKDDGARADLRIEITQEGNFWGPMDPDHGPVYLTGIERLTLTDARVSPPQRLDEQLRYAWSEPLIGPLFPAMTALGSGAKNDGASFKRVNRQSDGFDVAAILAHSGVRLGPVRPPATTQDQSSAPYSTALLASVLALTGEGTLSPGQSRMAREFVLQFQRSPLDKGEQPEIGEGERRLLQRLAKVRGDYELERTLTSMMGEHPDYFVDDFGALLRVVVTGTAEEAERAAKSASFGLFRSRRGDHDEAWPDYVAAIESGRSGELIRWIGRFNQDPLPVLRAELRRAPLDRHAWDTLSAVCHVDQRWWTSLIPFYHETAIRYLPSPGDTQLNGMEIHHAVRALVLMGRHDLAEEVVGRIDWSLVAKLPKMASPVALERWRASILELPDQPLGC